MTNNTDRLPEINGRHDAGYACPLDGLSDDDCQIVRDILDELTTDRAWLIAELEQTRSRLVDAEKALEASE